jgi:glycosyltransferase involved in cell wall biosynthesis
MSDDNSYLIDITGLESVPPDQTIENLFYTADHNWAAPSVEHTTALMRHVYEHREEAKAKGAQARADIRDKWPVTCTADWIMDHLQLRAITREIVSIGEGAPSTSTPIDKSQPTTVVWEGSQFMHHSLALINREMSIRFAQDKHIELSVLPVGPNEFGAKADPRFKHISNRINQKLSHPAEFHVRHIWPPVFTPPENGHWIVMQPWEFGSIPKDWITAWRDQADELWVYTNFVRDCYVQSGMPADRIQVIPCGVDVSKIHPKVPKLKLKTKKKFK